MKIDVVPLPSMLTDEHVRNRVVVVFDVLRATTTIATAMANGAKEIRVFDSVDAARSAAAQFDGDKLLCGETKCLPPPGFDLGNSPGDFTAERVAGKTIFLSTTNGTRAIVAAQGAARLFAAAAVNATATGKLLAGLGMDVTLLCAGTDGIEAPEDLLGAKLVEAAMQTQSLHRLQLANISSRSLVGEFLLTQGGRNILEAGLDADVNFAARLDRFDVVVELTGSPLVARKVQPS